MKKVYPKVKKIINKSLQQAKHYNDDKIRIEHIFIALINDRNNEAIRLAVENGHLEVVKLLLKDDWVKNKLNYNKELQNKINKIL